MCEVWTFVLLSAIALPGHASPPPWPNAPYSFFADKIPLESAIADFARSFSLSLNLAPGVQGVLNGKFTTQNPTEFISRLAGVYGLVWYVHNGTLYVSKAGDSVTRTVQVPAATMNSLQKALTDLGILEPRFGWGELPGQNAVLVSGPSTYVNLVEMTLKTLPVSAVSRQAMVFRLKYASSEDRTIRYRDREFVTPGLATILRAMVGQPGTEFSAGEYVNPMQGPVRRVTPLLPEIGGANVAIAADRAIRGADGEVIANDRRVVVDGATDRGAALTRLRPSIQSDPRLNALIIQDFNDRLPLYKQLIEQLDVPTSLIEIEAMIIDVNTDRARELGINWGGRASNVAGGFGNLDAIPPPGTLSVVGGSRSSGGALLNPGSLLSDTGNYLVSQIKFLESKGDASIQSAPSVTTVDNVGALLDLSETFYIRVTGERVANVVPITAGTTLKVTPRVITEGNERKIQLVIDIEDGQIQDRKVLEYPTVRRSSVSTQSIIRPDDTLLIAGYTQDQALKNVDKIPGLGDLPVIGAFFSRRTNSIQRRERLFMIKPRIISLIGPQTVLPITDAGAGLPLPVGVPIIVTPMPIASPTIEPIIISPQRVLPGSGESIIVSGMNAAASSQLPPVTGADTYDASALNTTQVGFEIELGPMEVNAVSVARAKAAFAIGWPVQKVRQIGDGDLFRLRAGPFAQKSQAIELAARIEAATNLPVTLREVDTDPRRFEEIPIKRQSVK